MSDKPNGTVRWIGIIVGVVLFAATVAFAAVQTSTNSQLTTLNSALSDRIKRVDKNTEDISTIKGEFRALSSVLEEKFKYLERELSNINKSLDKLAN